MSSLSFDRVAHAYDETRGYPPGVTQDIVTALESLAQATAETAFLEVGVGTGRIALPLAALGHRYTGVDISEKMLGQFARKLLQSGWHEQQEPWGSRADEVGVPAPAVSRFSQAEPPALLRLVTSDITALPFPDANFDVVVAVHIFHLVERWQQAVREVLRVLRPGGLLLHCWDAQDKSELSSIIETWLQIVAELGGNVRRIGSGVASEVSRLLREQGFTVEESAPVSWETTSTPRAVLEQISQRLWSRTWQVPDEIFQDSVARLEAWALEHFGVEQLDVPLTQMHHFIVHQTRLPAL